MKYICLGYMNEDTWENMSDTEKANFMDQCFIYDEELQANGHWAGGEALQEAQNTITLRWNDGKVAATDGPFIETKEHIGGIMILEATDMNHAVRLLSRHPSLPLGRGSASWEIRPAADLGAFIEETKRRRSKAD